MSAWLDSSEPHSEEHCRFQGFNPAKPNQHIESRTTRTLEENALTAPHGHLIPTLFAKTRSIFPSFRAVQIWTRSLLDSKLYSKAVEEKAGLFEDLRTASITELRSTSSYLIKNHKKASIAGIRKLIHCQSGDSEGENDPHICQARKETFWNTFLKKTIVSFRYQRPSDLGTIEDLVLNEFLDDFVSKRVLHVVRVLLPRADLSSLDEEKVAIFALLLFFDLSEDVYGAHEDRREKNYARLVATLSRISDKTVRTVQFYCPRTTNGALQMRMDPTGQVCTAPFATFKEKNNFSTSAKNLGILVSALQAFGWKAHCTIFGGDTDEEEYFFPPLGIKFADGADQLQYEAREHQRTEIVKQARAMIPQLEDNFEVHLWSEWCRKDFVYKRARQTTPEQDLAKKPDIVSSLEGPHYDLKFVPTAEMVDEIVHRKHGGYAIQGAEMDDRLGDHIFLETEHPKTKTFWYGYTRLPALYPFQKKTKQAYWEFQDI